MLLTEFTLQGLRDAVEKGVTRLSGGRCIYYDIEIDGRDLENSEWYFVVQYVDLMGAGEKAEYSKPFIITYFAGWPWITWQINNGQAVAVPYHNIDEENV